MPTSGRDVLSLLRSHAVRPVATTSPAAGPLCRFRNERIISKATAMRNPISQWPPLSVSTQLSLAHNRMSMLRAAEEGLRREDDRLHLLQ